MSATMVSRALCCMHISFIQTNYPALAMSSFSFLLSFLPFLPDPCQEAGIECNGVCDEDFLTGPYCNPSCDINNGGCTENQICIPRTIYCIRSPCPQPVECLDPEGKCL